MTTENKKNALAFVSPTDTAAGFEDMNMGTMAIPFISVIQSLSPQINKKKPEYIAGAEVGMFANSVTKELYGNTLRVIVLSFQHIYTEWKPNRGGFVGRHTVEEADRLAFDKSVFGKWKTAEGNTLSEDYVYFVLVAGKESEGPCVMSFSSTNIGECKKWNRMMTSTMTPDGRKALPHWSIWEVSTVERSNDKGSWYTIQSKHADWITAEQYQVTNAERVALPGKEVNYAQISGPEAAGPAKSDIPF
jgi:hypothetical protein